MLRIAASWIVAAALVACAAPRPPVIKAAAALPVEVERFQRAPRPPGERVGGRVAFVMPSGVTEMLLPVQASAGVFAAVRAGALVDAATRAALEDVLRTPPTSSAATVAPGTDVTLAVHTVRFAYRDRQLGVEWKQGLNVQVYESRIWLAFDASLVDAGGRVVHSRTYEEGDLRYAWTIPADEPRPPVPGLQAIVHEAAGRLGQRAAADVHRWLETERNRLRTL